MGERWTRIRLGSWARFGLGGVLLGQAASACGDSTKDQVLTLAGGAAGAGATAGTATGGTSSGTGGTRGGTAGASTGGTAGSQARAGGGGQASGGKGGATSGASGSGGTAGRGAGGSSGTDAMCGAGGEGGGDTGGDCPADVAGTWALGDDNLYVVIDDDCSVSNFCSIAEGIHTRGSVTHSVMLLSSVGGQPLAFAYTLGADTLTLIDAGPPDPDPVDLPLARSDEPLPDTCPTPGMPARTGAVGVRCSVEGDCAVGLDCTSRFFGERPICTTPCNGSCPDGAECVNGVPDYNSQPQAAHCFQPCQVSADCAAFGSQCDAYESGGARHCF